MQHFAVPSAPDPQEESALSFLLRLSTRRMTAGPIRGSYGMSNDSTTILRIMKGRGKSRQTLVTQPERRGEAALGRGE